MKTVVLLVLLILGAVASAPPAVAAPGAVHAAGIEPSELHPAAPAHLEVGLNAVVTTILHGFIANGSEIPLPAEPLTFNLRTKFGWLLLKQAETDAQGKAYLDYDPTAPGDFLLQVAFAGSAEYAPSTANLSLSVSMGPAGSPPLLPVDRSIVLVILGVVGGVWATYGFVAWLVVGIRTDRPETEKEDRRGRSASEVRRTMEGNEEPTKRVSGTGNAGSRAALYIAVAALALAGVGVGLVGITALTPKAASYTPGTIELQIAIVPDLQGGGWDVWLPNELTVHQGDTVKLTVINADEMDHGLEIEAFGVDVHIDPATVDSATQEIVPNVVQIAPFVANQVGQFLIKCNVVCGDGHDYMIGTLVVLPD